MAFAEKIGYPVVLRVVSPQIIHKSEVQGISLNLADAAAVRGGVRADATAPRRRYATSGTPRHVGPPHDPVGL